MHKGTCPRVLAARAGGQYGSPIPPVAVGRPLSGPMMLLLGKAPALALLRLRPTGTDILAWPLGPIKHGPAQAVPRAVSDPGSPHQA